MKNKIFVKNFIRVLLTLFVFAMPALAQKVPDPGAILTAGNGGRSITESSLQKGDILVSTTNENISQIIRNITSSPVSHALVYVGDGMVIEAIGSGVKLKTLEQATVASTIVVAYRYPKITSGQQDQIVEFAKLQLGKGYNFIGLVRHPNFKIADDLCNSYAGNNAALCKNWFGKVLNGVDIVVNNKIFSSKDEFFCSELVAAAYKNGGLNIFSKPADTNPGEIPIIANFQTLEYVGHFKD